MDADFLADLDDLSDDEPAKQTVAQADEFEDDDDDFGKDVDLLNLNDVRSIAKLTSEARYSSVVKQVALLRGLTPEEMLAHPSMSAPSEEDPLHALVVECNKLLVDIDNEIESVHKYIIDRYTPKFPELHQMVKHPVDYARVVLCIGNAEEITEVSGLEDLLPAATVMVVSVTASTTNGKPLSPAELQRTKDACDMCLQLDGDKTELLGFVESLMHRTAPNLSAAVGSEVAAKLIGAAGGIKQLMLIPGCNIQVLGAKRNINAGMSSASAGLHQGYVWNAPLVQNTPPSLRSKTARLVGSKAALLARMDAFHQDPSGDMGQNMLKEMQKKVEKWQEPPPAKQIKPLARPDAEPKKRRGGRRLRKMKEKFALTEVHKAANRVTFNFKEAEEEVLDGDEFVGLGQLGASGSGRLRVAAASRKVTMGKKAQKKLANAKQAYGSGGMSTISGLSSSLAFTPIQGIELDNPLARQQKFDMTDGTQSYFSETGGFKSVASSMPPPPPK